MQTDAPKSPVATADAPPAPGPKLGWDRICRMLVNLPYGREPDVNGWGIPELEVRPADPTNRKLAIRLAEAFYRAMDRGGSAGDGLWNSIRLSFHSQTIDVLEARDYDGLAAILAGMFSSPVTAGLCSHNADPVLAARDPMARLQTVDTIASLGISLGILQIPNPASPEPANVLKIDYRETLERISETLGWDIVPPQAGGIAGIPFRGGVIPLKHFFQVYAAHRIRSIHGGPLDSLVEIGGGVGLMAYHCAANNIVRDYTIIDLPLVNLLQGYLLLNSSVADDVVLYGESGDGPSDGRRIRILPDIAIGQLGGRSVDFAFNQDSFPEMGHQTMANYFDQIARIVTGHLLSINHESAQQVTGTFSHGLVHATLAGHPDFKQIYRMPYWMRPGYVEELFEVSSPSQP